MKRMTQEELLAAFETLAGMDVTSRAFRASERIRQHLVAVEAEAAQVRERALEEAATACETAAVPLALDEWQGTRHGLTRATADSLAQHVRALKSRPAQEPEPVLADCCSGAHPHELASEANGLLPAKRRREHEYGEEGQGQWGTWVAYCVRPGCKARRMKDRNRKNTCFYQHLHAPPTDEPGPCEVSS